jgi:hypothetical protein
MYDNASEKAENINRVTISLNSLLRTFRPITAKIIGTKTEKADTRSRWIKSKVNSIIFQL